MVHASLAIGISGNCSHITVSFVFFNSYYVDHIFSIIRRIIILKHNLHNGLNHHPMLASAGHNRGSAWYQRINSSYTLD